MGAVAKASGGKLRRTHIPTALVYKCAHFVKGVEGNPLAHALQNAKYSVLYFAIDK